MKQFESSASRWVVLLVLSLAAFGLPLQAQPVIIRPPQSMVAPVGMDFQLKVSATGAEPLSYYWHFEGTPIAGATNAGLAFSSLAFSDAGNYSVIVSNAGGSVSASVVLTVTPWGESPIFVAVTNMFALTCDPPRGLVYLTSSNQILRYDLNSNSFLAPFETAGDLRGLDVSPDGTTIVATDIKYYVTNVWFWVVNTSGGLAQSRTATNGHYESGTYAVSFGGDGAAILAGYSAASPGIVPLRRYDPATDELTTLTNFLDRTTMATSADGRFIAMISNLENPVALYDVQAMNFAQFSSFPSYGGVSVGINQDGSQVGVSAFDAFRILDGSLNSVTNIGSSTSDRASGVVYHPSTSLAYFSWSNRKEVRVYDMTNFVEMYRYHTGDTATNLLREANLRIAPDASWLIARATDGFYKFSLTNTPPSIAVQPVSLNTFAGSNATLTVIPAGTPPYFYEWSFNDTVLNDATNATLPLDDVQVLQTGVYRVKVWSPHGFVVSSNATVTVGGPPAIVVQPQSATLPAGTNHLLSVMALGSPPFSYYWQFGGVDFGAPNTNVLALANLQSVNAGDYSVIVSNAYGTATSQVASLTITESPPFFTSHPQSNSVSAGVTALFFATAQGTAPILYQWTFNDLPIPGGTNTTLIITNAQASDAGNYQLIAGNSVGTNFSEVATLTVNPAGPTFSAHPASVTAARGAEVGFKSSTYGTDPIAYQWRFNGGEIPGATDTFLLLTNVQNSNAGTYDLRATNVVGSAQSASATLTTVPPPGFLWARRGGGSSLDAGNATAVDAAGNVYFAGAFSGTATFGDSNVTAAGSTDVFLAKYDPAGNLLWLRQAGGIGEDGALGLATDGDGNVYVTGYFMFIANFSGLYVTNFNLSVGNRDVFVAKYDAEGDPVWVRGYGAGSSHDQGNGVAVDAAGNLFVTGQFGGTVNFGGVNLVSAGNNEVFLVKLDPVGAVLWARRAGGTSEDYGQAVATDPAGNAIITGYYVSSSINVNGINLTNVASAFGRTEIFLAKYDGSGTLLWARKAGGLQDDQGRGVCTDALGNILLTGHFASAPATFESLTISNLSSSIDVFLAKYDREGNILWVKSAGGTSADYGHVVAADAGGNCYLAGRFSGSINFGFTNLSGGGVYGFVAAYSAAGNGLWARRAGGGGQDQPNGIALDDMGNVYLGLQTASSTAQFGHVLLPTLGGTDACLAKLATVDALAPPAVTLHPSNQVAVAGANVTLSAGYSGGYPVSIQWRFNGADLPGETNLSLTLSNTTPALAGSYSFVLSNANGVVTSAVATVTVNIEPDFLWALGGGGVSDDKILGVVCDTNANTYVCGYFTGEFNLAGTNLVSAGGEDIFIAKFDSQTNLVWIQQAGGSGDDRANAITWDRYLGSVLVVGQFSGTADFSGLARTSAGGTDMFCASYRASDGLRGWVNRGGGTGDDTAHGIAMGRRIQSYSDFYVTGSFQGSAQFSGATLNSAGTNDIFVARYYSSGENFLGAVAAGGTGDDRGRAVSCDAAGNVFLAGAFSGTASFSGINLTSFAGYDVCLVKYNSSLTRLWARKAGTSLPSAGGGNYHDEATAVAADAYGNVFVAGYFNNQATFGGLTNVARSANQPDVFLAKYDANGTVLWAISAGGANADTAASLAVDIAGNPYLAGSFTAPATFNPFLPSTAGGAEAFIAMYDATGRLLKLRRAGSALDDAAWSVASDHAGNAVLGGTHGAAGAFGGFALAHSGAHDAFVAKVAFFTPGLPPVITSQPMGAVVSNGVPASLSVGVLSSTPVSCQWFFNGAPIAGATNNMLVFASVSFANLGSYFVTISNAFGTITSDAAALRIEQTPEVLWAVKQGSTGDDQALAVAVDAAGNVYAAGLFSGTVAFGTSNLVSAGGTDVFLAKYNPQGGLLWARRYGGTGADAARVLQVDSAGNIYFAGYFFSLTATFGPFTLTNRSLPGGFYSDFFVARCDPAGNLLWVRSGAGSWNPNFVNHNDVATALATDAVGNAYLTGWFHSSGVFGSQVLTNLNTTNFFLAKYDSAGNVLWARTTTGVGTSHGSGVCVDAATNVYVTGHLFGSINLGSGVITNTNSVSSFGNGTVFVAKYDADGALQWARKGGTNGLGFGQAIAADAAGNVFATSYRRSYGGGVMLTKYDGAGNALWWRTNSLSCCTGDYISAAGLALDSGGNPVVAGYLNGIIQNQTNFYIGGYVLKYRSDGVSQWFQRCGNSSGGTAVAFDPAGNFYVVGQFTGTSFFGSSSNLVSSGFSDAFLVKFGIRPPTVTSLPGDRLVTAGSNANLSVSTTGAAANYQWQFNGVNLPGATNATLALNNFNSALAGRYAVVIQSASGWTTSAVAGVGLIPVLRILPASNGVVLNWDGDFTLQSALDISGPYADMRTGYGPYTQPVAADEGQRYFRLGVSSPDLNGIMQPDGLVLNFSGSPGRRYTLLSSTNLTDWNVITTDVFPFALRDADLTSSPQKFYRTRLEP